MNPAHGDLPALRQVIRCLYTRAQYAHQASLVGGSSRRPPYAKESQPLRDWYVREWREVRRTNCSSRQRI